MGARSLIQQTKHLTTMMRKPLRFGNVHEQDVTQQVKEIIDRFKWDPAWVLPEIFEP
jgi:hypothetical protein